MNSALTLSPIGFYLKYFRLSCFLKTTSRRLFRTISLWTMWLTREFKRINRICSRICPSLCCLRISRQVYANKTPQKFRRRARPQVPWNLHAIIVSPPQHVNVLLWPCSSAANPFAAN
jgi:hypothetical protein